MPPSNSNIYLVRMQDVDVEVVTCRIVKILAHSSLCQELDLKLAAVVHILLNALQNML